MPVRLNSSGGGSVTLDVPAVGTTTTLNLPTANGTLLASDGSGNVTVSGATTFSGNATFNAGLIPSSSFLRNRLINGGMEIAQRGSSGTIGYLLDRWQAQNTSAQSQTTDAPSGFINSVEFTSSSATFPLILQRIERANSYDLAGRTVTLSFWAKSLSGSAILYVEAYRANANDNFSSVTLEAVLTVSASPSTSWTFYSVSFPLSASATTGLEIRIVRNNASAASTRVTGVQLEVGSVATPFERRQFEQELALCQRYCFVLNQNGVATGVWGGLYSSTAGRMWTKLPVTMRANPSLSNTSNTNTFEMLSVAITSGTLINFASSRDYITFDAVSLGVSSVIGLPLCYIGPGTISAEL